MALLIRSRLIDKVGAEFMSMVIRGNSKKELHDAFYKLFIFMNDCEFPKKGKSVGNNFKRCNTFCMYTKYGNME